MIPKSAVFGLSLFLATPAFAGEDAIRGVLEDFEKAFNAGDAAAVAALYTEDAAVLPPGGGFVRGRAAIEEMWQGALDSGFVALDLQPMEIVIVGDTAYETSTFVGTIETEEGKSAAHGKYIVVWQKTGDGAWRLHRDIWNEMPAPE
ncbi:MAG: SgcJ/EcaC family oxidoreductase [Rhodovibrionaceae bacterium]|nr:SgcJ/EcaC family oxidoreductase [Rhodovibrionaceae bacterium]